MTVSYSSVVLLALFWQHLLKFDLLHTLSYNDVIGDLVDVVHCS